MHTFLIFLIIGLGLIGTSCSTYTFNEQTKCSTYRPICIHAGSTLSCKKNRDACETCDCVNLSDGEQYKYSPSTPTNQR